MLHVDSCSVENGFVDGMTLDNPVIATESSALYVREEMLFDHERPDGRR
jgi:hypothetical protein